LHVQKARPRLSGHRFERLDTACESIQALDARNALVERKPNRPHTIDLAHVLAVHEVDHHEVLLARAILEETDEDRLFRVAHVHHQTQIPVPFKGLAAVAFRDRAAVADRVGAAEIQERVGKSLHFGGDVTNGVPDPGGHRVFQAVSKGTS
jgi:hypothetical protein